MGIYQPIPLILGSHQLVRCMEAGENFQQKFSSSPVAAVFREITEKVLHGGTQQEEEMDVEK